MKVAAEGGGEVGGEVRPPEPIGNEVDDALFGLQGAGDAQDGGGLSQAGVPHGRSVAHRAEGAGVPETSACRPSSADRAPHSRMRRRRTQWARRLARDDAGPRASV